MSVKHLGAAERSIQTIFNLHEGLEQAGRSFGDRNNQVTGCVGWGWELTAGGHGGIAVCPGCGRYKSVCFVKSLTLDYMQPHMAK
jgi:hypothetical protein